MTRALCRRLPVVVLATLGVQADLHAAQTLAEYTMRIAAELRARDPEAAEVFARANAARDRREWAEAERLYREVLRLEPGYVHATRRLCGVVLDQGRRAEALALCREALHAADIPENHEQLLWALLGKDEKSRPTAKELREARGHANLLLSVPDPNGATLSPACAAAIELKDVAMLRRCVGRLEEVAPSEVETHFYEWFVAMSDRDFDAAEKALERAHSLGLPEEQYASMKAETDKARPWLPRLVPLAGAVLGAWGAGLLALFGLGLVLSRVALKVAQEPPALQTGEPDGMAGSLRRAYQAVLGASCVYYYLSIPIVLVLVVVGGGGLIYAFFAIGHVPIKLVLIVGVVVLVTVWAALKSLFIRARDEDPGDRLEAGKHPRLRRVLDEVAGQIGTRPVDNVYMTPGTDLAVTERGGMVKQFQGTSERCLILGAGVLDGMKMGPFRAVLTHEYGHFSNRDTAGGGFALAVRRSLLTMAQSLAEGGAATWYNPAWLFLYGFHLIFLRISQGASRLQEIMADRWAAFAYGAKAFEQGLRHVVERSIRFQAHANATLQEVVDGKRALANLYSYRPSKAPAEREIVEAVEEAIHARPWPYDSHPSPVDRFALVNALRTDEARQSADAEQDAWCLFDDPAAVQCWMTDRIRANVERNHGVAIPRGA
jgi:Zn-dependent protease with chaperone function